MAQIPLSSYSQPKYYWYTQNEKLYIFYRNIGLIYCSSYSYRSPNFVMAKVVALNLIVCTLVNGFFSVLLSVQILLFQSSLFGENLSLLLLSAKKTKNYCYRFSLKIYRFKKSNTEKKQRKRKTKKQRRFITLGNKIAPCFSHFERINNIFVDYISRIPVYGI